MHRTKLTREIEAPAVDPAVEEADKLSKNHKFPLGQAKTDLTASDRNLAGQLLAKSTSVRIWRPLRGRSEGKRILVNSRGHEDKR